MTIQYIAGYKYQLFLDYGLLLPKAFAGADIAVGYLTLGRDGFLTVGAGYAWDGPSGPTMDTPDSMRASLVHDALYQLIRLGKLSNGLRAEADKVFREICVAAGMGKIRAYSWWLALRLFGAAAADPKAEPKIVTAP